MPYIEASKYVEKIETIVRLEEENEKLKQDIQHRVSMNTNRVRCKKTDCPDHNKELCSPWMCSHYLMTHDKFIKLDTMVSIKNEIENALDIRDRYWKGLQKAIDIINKQMTLEQS